MTLFADSGCQAASSYICAVALCVWSLRLVSAFKMNFYSLDLFWIVAADRYGFCCHIVPNSVLQQERIGKQMDACQCHGFLNYDLSTELNRQFTWLTHKTLFVDSKCHARQLLIIGAEPDSQTVSLSDTFCIQDESSVFYMSRPSADSGRDHGRHCCCYLARLQPVRLDAFRSKPNTGHTVDAKLWMCHALFLSFWSGWQLVVPEMKRWWQCGTALVLLLVT